MLKRFLFLVVSALVLTGCTLKLPSLPGGKKAGLQVSSFPQANVYLNDTLLGLTPLTQQEDLQAGPATIKIVPQDPTLQPYETKVNLTPGVLTYVDHKFSPNPEMNSGHILSFEPITNKKTAQIDITTLPNTVSISVDSAPQDFSPTTIETVPEGDHRILLSSPGYEDKLVTARTINGYKLIILAQLAKRPAPTPTPEPTVTPEPTASLTPSPTTKPKATPTPTKTATSSATLTPRPYAEILETGTGWLRVRSTPSSSGTEVAKVNVGETFPYISTDPSGWTEITYTTGKNGWVSSQYVKVVK